MKPIQPGGYWYKFGSKPWAIVHVDEWDGRLGASPPDGPVYWLDEAENGWIEYVVQWVPILPPVESEQDESDPILFGETSPDGYRIPPGRRTPMVKIIGGPLDGGFWMMDLSESCGPDSTFVPLKTSWGRPRYRFQPASTRGDGEDAWVFEAWESE